MSKTGLRVDKPSCATHAPQEAKKKATSWAALILKKIASNTALVKVMQAVGRDFQNSDALSLCLKPGAPGEAAGVAMGLKRAATGIHFCSARTVQHTSAPFLRPHPDLHRELNTRHDSHADPLCSALSWLAEGLNSFPPPGRNSAAFDLKQRHSLTPSPVNSYFQVKNVDSAIPIA